MLYFFLERKIDYYLLKYLKNYWEEDKNKFDGYGDDVGRVGGPQAAMDTCSCPM